MRLGTALFVVCLLGAPTQSLAQAPSASPDAIAAAQHGLDGDVAVSSTHVSARSGVSYVYLERVVDGIPVLGATQTVALTPSGTAVYRSGDLGAADPPRGTLSPLISAPEAVAAAAARLGAVRIVPEAAPAPAGRRAFRSPALRQNATARRAWHRRGDERLRLVWETTVWPVGADGPWRVLVDAGTGETVGAEALGHACFLSEAPSRPKAVPLPAASPLSPSGDDGPPLLAFALPGVDPEEAGERALLTAPADPSASPDGWFHPAASGVWQTDGPNARGFLHRDGTRAPVASTADGFVAPLDLSGAPAGYGEAAAANAFYLVNRTHDLLWHYGFTRAAGNFEGDDPIVIEVQAEGPPGAFFAANADGDQGVMRLRVWNYTDPQRDPALDASVVVHEYAHGLTSRLVGGASRVGCVTNAEQMAEGWSDWYALMLTMRAEHTRTTPRGIAGYLLGDPAGGTVRDFPYAADLGLNPLTYADTPTAADVYDTGTVWATILWELTWDLIDRHGFDPDLTHAAGPAGNQVALSLVTEALKLMPCRGGFVDARNAILAGDQALYDGAHSELLWGAFARRGLGGGAAQGSAEVNTDNVASFEPPGPARFELASDTTRLRVGDAAADAALRVLNVGERGLVLRPGPAFPTGVAPLWDERVVGVGGTGSLPIRVTAEALGLGLHALTVPIATNDPDRPLVEVPLLVYNDDGASRAIGYGPGRWRLLGAPFGGVTPRHLDRVTPLAGFSWSTESRFETELLVLGLDGTFEAASDGNRAFTPGEPFLWRAGSSTVSNGKTVPLWLPPPFGSPLDVAPAPTTYVFGRPLGFLAPPTLAPVRLDSLESRLEGGLIGSATAQVWNDAAGTFEVAGARSTLLQPWEVAVVESGFAHRVRIDGPPTDAPWPGVVEIEVRSSDRSRDRALVIALGADVTADAPKLRPFRVPFVAAAIVDSDARRPLRAAAVHDPASGLGVFDVILVAHGDHSSTESAVVSLRLGPNARVPDSLRVYAHVLRQDVVVEVEAVDGPDLSIPVSDYTATGDVLPPTYLQASTSPMLRLYIVEDGAPLPWEASDDDTEAPDPPDLPGLGPVYPNPATASVTIPLGGGGRLSIVDSRGREVLSLTDLPYGAAPRRVSADVGDLAPGIYVVRLISGGDVWTQPLAIVR